MPYTSADLDMVERHIAQGERHVALQEELITRLSSLGLPTEAAEDLLEEFRATLRQHRSHQALIAAALAHQG